MKKYVRNFQDGPRVGMGRGETGIAVTTVFCAGIAAASLDAGGALAGEALDIRCRLPQEMSRALGNRLCGVIRSGIEDRLAAGTGRAAGAPAFIFEVTHYRQRAMSGSVSGRLRWRPAGEGWISGPQVSATITDAPFDSRLMSDFAHQIVATGRF